MISGQDAFAVRMLLRNADLAAERKRILGKLPVLPLGRGVERAGRSAGRGDSLCRPLLP
jgi:hypothetical protein